MISSLKNKQTIQVGQPKSSIIRSSTPVYLSSPLRKKDNNTQNKQHLSNEVRTMSSELSNPPPYRFTSIQQKFQDVIAKPATASSTPIYFEQSAPVKTSSQSITKYQSSKESNPSKKLAIRIQGLTRISSSSNSSSSKQSLSSSQSASSLSSQDHKKANKINKNKEKQLQKRDVLSSSSDSMQSSLSSNSSLNSSFESNHKKNKQVDKLYQKNNQNTYSFKSDDRKSHGLTKAQIQAKQSIEQMNKIFGNDPKEQLKISKEVVKQLNQQLALERNKKVARKYSDSSELSHSKDSDSSLSSQSSSSFENDKTEIKSKKSKESQVKKHQYQPKEKQQSELSQLKKKNPYL